MTCTLKQLAEQLNVSIGTVSLALRNSPLVAEKTRKRIIELAESQDYVQSSFGRALQSRCSKLIGVLLPTLTSSFFNELLQGAGEGAVSSGYGLMLGWITEDKEYTNPQITLMLEKEIDALIIASHGKNFDFYANRFIRRNKPVVYCNGSPSENCSSVCTDDVLGGKLAVQALAEYGHKKILCAQYYSSRWAGNQAAASQYGVQLVPFTDYNAVLPLFAGDRDITGIVCHSDEGASLVMHTLRHHGYSDTGDFSIIGYNDLSIASHPEFQLTTVAQQRKNLGSTAVEIALEQLKNPGNRPTHRLLDPFLVKRQTLNPARRRKK